MALQNSIQTLTSTVNGKANTSHTHTSSQISDLNALKIEIFKMIYPIPIKM